MSTLERAIEFASRSLAGKTDKAERPLILHALRVMLKLEADARLWAGACGAAGEGAAGSEILPIVGVLHDVIEDGETDGRPVTAERLRQEGFDEAVISAVDCLSKRPGEAKTRDGGYPPEYLARVKSNPIALRVKLADLEDNMDITRLPNPGPDDWERLYKKYLPAYIELRRLSKVLP